MAKYRKKPIIVEAEQFFHDRPLPFSPAPVVAFNGDAWYVVTIHGQETTVVDGDWIIREAGTIDRAYPCKPAIFDATYDPVVS